jgi:hypothetical protein
MTTQELRITINHLVNTTEDPEILQSIYTLLKKMPSVESEDEIVGYEADGTPITVAEFIQSVIEADEDIENGNVISFQAMKAKYGAS